MLEKMNTGQTVYEQLQEILNKCIELGWKPWGGEYLTISKGKPKTINLIEDRKISFNLYLLKGQKKK